MRFLSHQTIWILVFFILIGSFLRLYNLNWGAPFYFHPDERNIASAVSQLVFPEQMNPHFFAYGSLPLYVIFFTGLVATSFSTCQQAFAHCQITFEQAIIISRFYSALFSILLIPLLFFLGKRLYGETGGILAAGLATFSVGFIQFAHFGTTEMWLALFSTLFFTLTLSLSRRLTVGKLVLLGLVSGILIATKVSSLVLLILPLPALYLAYRKQTSSKTNLKILLKTSVAFVLILWIAALFFFVTNPFIMFDTTSFRGSLTYESSLAVGTLPVFYTQEFFNTIPGIYQLFSVYPFLLNPLFTLLLLPALGVITYRLLKKKESAIVLLVLFFLSLFVSQAIMFVKWTRYMLPTLPFVYLILAGATLTLTEKKHKLIPTRAASYTITVFFILFSSFFAFAYLLSTYAAPDTRLQAAKFAKERLPANASYLSEVYDLGITPFNPLFQNIVLFNFYDLDTDSLDASPKQLETLQENTDYLILPSQRIYKTRLMQPERFPRGHRFYSGLKTNSSYTKIYETPCDFFCRITYLGDPVFSYEESASVFDRPTVMIYKKND